MAPMEEFIEMLKSHNRIVFFGGAGVSTESDIPDFRGKGGLYRQKTELPWSPEEMLSHHFYAEHPVEFFTLYKEREGMMLEAEPNRAHTALAELEKMGKLYAVVTQNIDGLHQMAGSKNVIELHGSIHRNYCTKCHKFYDLDYIIQSDGVPKCSCGGIIKPDVVLYEEGLNNDDIENAIRYISEADTLIIGGTSLVVYPAAGLIRYFRGKHLVVINMSPTQTDSQADLLIADKIGKVLGQL
mgnify:CR=1 FL=1